MPKQHFLPSFTALAVLAALLAAVPAPAADPGTGPRPHADSAYAANIDAALGYMLKDRSWGRWMNLTVLDFLQRKFGLGEQYRHGNTFGPPHPSKGDLALVEPLGRIVDPAHQHTPGNFPEEPGPYDFMEHALYCDRIPVSGDFFERLQGAFAKHAGKGGIEDYFTVNHALAFQWMIENGCAWEHEGARELQAKLGDALMDIVLRNGRDRGVSFEAVAFLHYMGLGDRVPKVWLDQIIEAQQPDGGWKQEPSKKFSDGRSTVLALWVLLEAAMPGAPDVPWIQKAGADPAGK